MRRRPVLLLTFTLALFLRGTVAARLRPENVLVVINSRNQDSIEVGLHYAEKRGIPGENVVRLFYPRRKGKIRWPEFKEDVFDPVMAHIREKKLERRIHLIALTRGIPYKVQGEAATWLFYAHGVRLKKRNPYFGARRPLNAWRDLGPGRYASVMLTGFTRDEAKAMIDRGLASDATHPNGTVYFLRGGPYRDVRKSQVPPAAAELELMGIRTEILNGTSIENKPDVLGYMTGATWVSVNNTYLPGAFADHLTSFAGQIYRKSHGQMSILHYIRAGATGSCGTVVEPLNDWHKFPTAAFYVTYAQGFTLGETMWQSVATPYQVIFVGDPLACPFARECPSITILKPHGDASDPATWRVRADAGAHGHRVAGILCSLDGRPPAPLSAEIQRDTRVGIAFAGRASTDPDGKPRLHKTVITGLIPVGKAPAVALAEIAEQIRHLDNFPVDAAVKGNALELTYHPGTRVAPVVRCECRGGGAAPAWLPAESLGRFRGQSLPRPARATFRVKGWARRDSQMGLTIGDTQHLIQVSKGRPSHEILQAMVATFADDERIAGPDGLNLSVTKGQKGMARLMVHSKKPGPEWNGCRVKLIIGRNEALSVFPHERVTNMVGGTLTSPGRYRLELIPHRVPRGRKIAITVGRKEITFTDSGHEPMRDLLVRLVKQLREIGPDLQAHVDLSRIVLTSNADEAPALEIRNHADDFTAELLGGRWARLRDFPPKEGKKNRPLKYKWLASLHLRRGVPTLECPIGPEVSALAPGEHTLTFYVQCTGPWRTTAHETVRLVIRSPTTAENEDDNAPKEH